MAVRLLYSRLGRKPVSYRIDVIIVGAGPYGLSLAAHLCGLGVAFRIFGRPMESWQERMPKGMLLKSDGFVSNLSSPDTAYSLKAFCETRGIPYCDTKAPVKLETFIEYGLWFQRHLVPEIDTRRIVRIERGNSDFSVETDNGEIFEAKHVVLAVGTSKFAWVPPQFAELPASLLTHSSDHKGASEFDGKEVTIIGGGDSAIDLAALLHEQGAKVCIIARRHAIAFHDPPPEEKRTIWQQLRNPSSGLGPGWKSRIYTDAPFLFRLLPAKRRLKIVREHLGPAPGWSMRGRVVDKVPMVLGARNITASVVDGRVRLLYLDRNCHRAERMTDHVIAATGYRADVKRLRFLSPSIQKGLNTLADTPVLSSRFESSVRGLYFVGLAAANSFGPMMRFAFGAEYTSRHLARHLQQKVTVRKAKVMVVPTEALN